ncbi:MAG: M48 family metallopeptidase [Calditrichaceae bacterium]|nr:M48 family metallopeptidase [Calditrichaceae bacterium]
MTQKNQAKTYERIKLILNISETIIYIGIILILIFGGWSAYLRDLAASCVENVYFQLLIFIGILGFVLSVFSVPLSFISGFWMEHYYNLSNQTFWAWLWEKIKAFLVGIILSVPLLLLFYYLLSNYPETWWIWMAAALFFFSVLIGRIAPVVIFPLFYKFDKLADEEIVERMEKLAKEGNFKLDGVYRFNMSKTTKKANAAFTGMGKSKRIILGDTLLDEFSLDEIESVFAHEVGHYVHKHLMINVAIGTINSFLSLFIAHLVYNYLLKQIGFTGQADLAALPLLFLILTIISLIMSPLTNMLSRSHERQADKYALKKSSNAKAFLTAMKKLAKINLADESPHPVIEFLFHSHPSISKRIQFAKSLGVQEE